MDSALLADSIELPTACVSFQNLKMERPLPKKGSNTDHKTLKRHIGHGL